MRQPSIPTQRTDEYDLQQNLKKVRQYQQQKPQRAARQTSDPSTEWIERNNNDRISSTVASQGPTTSSGDWKQYTHLDDKISDFQAQNENAHLQIRKDFDVRVGEEVKNLRDELKLKLPIKWYTWTVAAIVSFVGLIYLLSYSGVLSTQDKHSEEIKSIQLDVNGMKNEVKTLQDDVRTLQNDVNTLQEKETKSSQSQNNK